MADQKLTPQQEQVIQDRGGPLLVAAAAGSGKTKVLVDRLLSYIRDPVNPADIDQFLIITYTKAAASELRSKIATRLGECLAAEPDNRHLQRQLQRLYLARISTVHSFCGDVLREYSFLLDLPGDMRTVEGSEADELSALAMEQVLEDAYSRIGTEPDIQAFADTQGLSRTGMELPQIILDVVDKARCHTSPQAWLREMVSAYEGDLGEDAAQTTWGKELVDELKRSLEVRLQELEVLQRDMEYAPDIQQKRGPDILEVKAALERLLHCSSWDQIRESFPEGFSKISVVRKPSDPELNDRVKDVRNDIIDWLKKTKNRFRTPSAVLLGDLRASAPAMRGMEKLVLAYMEAFRQEKLRRRVQDFGDLEHRMLELLRGRGLSGPTRAAREIGARFREIMVDEYQDSNEVQETIFSTLTQERGNLFMVGDVKQAIYRFRMADPKIFLKKYEAFRPAEEAEPGEGRKILLSMNFRSGAPVLEAANQVFRMCMSKRVGDLDYGPEEELHCPRSEPDLAQPAVELHCIDAAGEGKLGREPVFVAERIHQLLTDGTKIRGAKELRPVMASDIAILMRSPRNNAAAYIEALARYGIHATAETNEDVLTSDEIAVLRALLQVLDNPMQDIPLEAVLTSPLYGFTADDLGRVRIAGPKVSLYRALQAAAEQGNGKAADFLTGLTALRETARLETLVRLIEEIYRITHIEAVFSAMTDGERRKENLELFYGEAASYEQGGRRDLPQFLAYLDRLGEKQGLQRQKGAAANAVQILSIHRSKGLEYPVVFLCNLSAKFNTDDLKKPLLVDPFMGIGCSCLNSLERFRYPTLARLAVSSSITRQNISEELRLLYVAMTRAKDMLIMTCAQAVGLQKQLATIARNLEPSLRHGFAARANSMAHWVLMTAMSLSEAGELFAHSDRPAATELSRYPWRICYHEPVLPAPEQEQEAAEVQETPAELPSPEGLTRILNARYGHPASTQAPSKVTATQLKGRNLDEEAADGAFTPLARPARTWRRPEFLTERPLQGREIGTATHLAMQFIRYAACTDADGVEAELARLEREAFLNPRQAKAVNRRWIVDFFQTDLGRLLREDPRVHREFKFSLLTDGGTLDPDLQGESLLLQGVVDCFLEEDDGLTVLDFKTDRVRPGFESETAARYAPQVQAYAGALTRIYGKPVKRLLLYFFQTGCLYPVEVR